MSKFYYLLPLVLFFVVFQSAHATQKIEHVYIDFSESCQILDSLNDTSKCSSREFLKEIYPEAQLKESYKILFENAERQNKEAYQQNDSVKNHINACIKYNACNIFNLNKNQKMIYWYDLPDYARDFVDYTITIQPNILHKTYDFPGIIHDNGTERKIEYDVNQIVISSCHRITYNPINIVKEFGFIIYYISNHCVNEKHLGPLAEPYQEDLTKTEFNPWDSPSYQYREFLESLKTKYKEYRIGKD